jgi:hypothetical protein
MTLDNCSAVITGASAGIGRELARQLAPRAKLLVLVARRRDRLEELGTELQTKNPALCLQIRDIDLANLDQAMHLAALLTNEPIDFLINNAGLGDRGTFVTAEPERLHQMLAVNVVALTMLTRALLPAMIEKKRGAILNVSSSAGFLPIRKMAVYAASKAYVSSFSDAIRGEVRKQGIVVSALCPGPVDTEFSSVARRSIVEQPYPSPSFMHVRVEDVVRAGLNAIERNKALVVPGLVMKIAMLLVRLTPMAILRRV